MQYACLMRAVSPKSVNFDVEAYFTNMSISLSKAWRLPQAILRGGTVSVIMCYRSFNPGEYPDTTTIPEHGPEDCLIWRHPDAGSGALSR